VPRLQQAAVVPLTGICMCGHPSSLHTGNGCSAKFVNPKGEQVTCSCPFFMDKGDPDD
jgi:hypothetical protein